MIAYSTDLYGTDKWDSKLWRTVSNRVIVTIKYDDGTRIVKESHTYDGKWADEKKAETVKLLLGCQCQRHIRRKKNER